MKHRAFALFAAILLLSLSSGAVLAAPVLDQSNEAPNHLVALVEPTSYAQSVTTGMAGTLARVSLYLTDNAASGHTIIVQVEGVKRETGFPPDGTVRAWATGKITSGGFYDFSLNQGVNLLAGAHFCIVVTISDTLTVLATSGDLYAGGQYWQLGQSGWYTATPYDLFFRTWMEPAQPTPTPAATPSATPAATPAPAAQPTPATQPTQPAATGTTVASVAPSGLGSEVPPATASVGSASGTDSGTGSEVPTATASVGSASGTDSGGGTDWTLAIAFGVVALMAVGVGGGFLLGRRRRSS